MHFGVCVATVQKVNHEGLNMRKMCTNFIPSAVNDEQMAKHVGDNRRMIEHFTYNARAPASLVTLDKHLVYSYDPETKRQGSQWKQPDSRTPDKASPLGS